MRTTRRPPLALAACLLLGVAACGGGTPQAATPTAQAAPNELDDATVEELYEQAQAEGSVVVYSFTSRIAEVEQAFEAQYPGVDLIGNDISSTEQIARIRAEADAGTPGADVAYISDAPVVTGELVRDGLLQKYVPTRVADSVPAQFQEPLLANRLSTKILMYNEEANPAGSPVTNLWELTQPQWRGRVVMVDSNVRGDYLDLMTEIVLRSPEMEQAYTELNGEELVLGDGVDSAGAQWISDLYANDVVLVDDTDNVNAAVGTLAQTDPPVGFTSYSDRRDNADEGWALQAATGVEPAPGIAFPALLGLVKDAAHPAAARLVIDFLMGDDCETGGPGFEPFAVAGDYPVREDIAPSADAVSLDELGAWVIDSEEVFEVRADVSDLLITLG